MRPSKSRRRRPPGGRRRSWTIASKLRRRLGGTRSDVWPSRRGTTLWLCSLRLRFVFAPPRLSQCPLSKANLLTLSMVF